MRKDACNDMDNESKVIRNVWITLGVLAAVAVALWALIRTERRLHRVLGFIKGRVPTRRKNREFRIELENI